MASSLFYAMKIAVFTFGTKASGSHTDAIESHGNKSLFCQQTVSLCGMAYMLGFMMAIGRLRNRLPSFLGIAGEGLV